MILQYLWLIPLGFIVGAYATVIGAGGGFLLAPVLLLLYPRENPETIASISLAVVFFNSLSGSIAYARAKRIDYKSGLFFSAAAIPGAIFGALTTSLIARGVFDLVFGIVMIAASAFLFYRPKSKRQTPWDHQLHHLNDKTETARPDSALSYNPVIGIGVCFLIGYVTSLLGVGGGFIEVPAMVYLLNFPVHIATATSQFIVMIMALAGSATHIAAGLFHHGVRRTLGLALGVILGAQLGARLSARVRGDLIIRSLAIGLGFVGVGLIFKAL